MLEYLLAANSKVSSNKLLDHMIGYTQVVNEPTHIFESQIDHVYINSALLEELHTKAIIQNIYFSDHDVVRIVFQKNDVDFTVSNNWCKMLLGKF